MAVVHAGNYKEIPLNVVGSSTFGRYPKVNAEYTYNMLMSQEWLINYIGYKIGINSSEFGEDVKGRAIYTSVKLGAMIAVIGKKVYLIRLTYDKYQKKITSYTAIELGEIGTSRGPVFISENNKPQIVISDESSIYVYDSQATVFTGTISSVSVTPFAVITYTGGRPLIVGEPVTFSASATTPPPVGVEPIVAGVEYYVSSANLTDTTFSVTDTTTNAKLGLNSFSAEGLATATFVTQGTFQRVTTSFRPGMLTFHDTYILCAARDDTYYQPAANNTWRLSEQNNAFVFANDAASIGLIQTKPDNTVGIIRFPSGGDMIIVLGNAVTEPWYDSGAQLFPYQRNNQFNIDYGCVSATSIVSHENIAMWLGYNERSAPCIMQSDGGMPRKITTDGIDHRLYELQKPEDCEAFIFRLNNHLIYHINFFHDNFSLFYDINEDKFFNACDQNNNYFHITGLTLYKNQYFGISKDSGHIYIVGDDVTYYRTTDSADVEQTYVIPRTRACGHVRELDQNYSIANDVGVTIESGETDYEYQYVETSPGEPYDIISQAGDHIISQAGDQIVSQELVPGSEVFTYVEILPKAYLSVSRNGGATYSSLRSQTLRPIGRRINKLQWWNLGIANDMICQFRFNSYGRVAISNGIINVRR
jgi:hypothetical protein